MERKNRKNYGVKDVVTVVSLIADYGGDFKPKASYRKTKKTEKLIEDDRAHAMVVGKAHRLCEDMIDRKATKKEIQRAVRYLMVCIDAKKYKLDYRKAHADFGIRELSDKYSANYMVV